METHLDNYWNGRFLEWTWDLFWNKCLKNIPIRRYLGERIVDIISIESDKSNLNKNMILQFLNKNDYYYVDYEIKLITNHNKYTCKNQYIYNKFL